jgi:hypothetical protein
MATARRIPVAALLISALVAVAVLLVAASLRRPEPPTYTPSAAAPRPIGDSLVGPLTYTIDASDPEAWRFFDFSRASRVEDPEPLEWDLAFRRFNIVANGGEGFAGKGGALDLGEVAFDSLVEVPAEGYQASRARRDTVNAALEGWYDYGFTSHLLKPAPRVYALRTADGRYAKLEILSYHCPGALPGCVTFRYVYQGAGGTELVSGVGSPRSEPAR